MRRKDITMKVMILALNGFEMLEFSELTSTELNVVELNEGGIH